MKMSLSCLLRGGLNGLKVRQSVGRICQYSSISSLASQKLLTPHSHDTNLIQRDQKVLQIKLPEAVRQFSTSPARLSGHGDHSRLWSVERYVSAGLLVMVPLGLMLPNILLDILIAVGAVMHMHWGIEAIVVDYVRPIIFGNMIPKIAALSVYLLSIFTLVGLLNLILNNAGLCNSIRLIWKL